MIISFPIGPLGVITIQRIISRGWKIGFFSGMGTAASDAIYSSIAVLGMSFVDDFICRNRHIFNDILGILFLIIGINIFINALNPKKVKEEEKNDLFQPVMSNFLIGLSNPMTFLIFVAIFTKLKIDVDAGTIMQNIALVVSIFCGSSIFWYIVSNFIDKTNKNIKVESFFLIDKVIGIALMLFGIYSVSKGLLRL